MSSIATPDWSALPVPEDDGAARHLAGLRVPAIPLSATDGSSVDLSSLAGRVVVYAYPRTGRPGESNPAGWEAIPGARGCTPQTCAFRDHFAELCALGAAHLYGLSTQETAYQRELVERLQLPFAILSDASLTLTHALRLPTFQTHGMTLLRRLTAILRNGVIEHVFYPVFPPDQNALDVISWLQAQSGVSGAVSALGTETPIKR